MSNIQIDKGVKIPKPDYKYPFLDLKVNESFTPGKPTDELKRNIISLASYYGKKHKKEFKTGIDDDGNLRVWRIK